MYHRRLQRNTLAIAALTCAMMPPAMQGQFSTGTLYGTVTDSTGAIVPGATLTVTQTDTNTTRTITAKSDGSYRADFLPVGPYTVTVTASGFKTLERSGIVLNVTEQAKLDLQLAVGGSTEVVEVTADVPLLNTGNSILGRIIDNTEIDNLPLVNRDVYTLLDLTPGVQNNSSSNPLGFPEQHVSINGSTDGATGQVSFYLDGGSNMTGLRNTGNPLPNPDAIKEFAVQTNNFSAQFGRSSGGVVTALTKSGTNAYHGSIFEFYRTKNFNAITHNNTTKGPYNLHRFGFTAGGPVKRDKILLFGSYAGFRFISSDTLVSTVPSDAMRNGNFSENLPTTGTNAGKTGAAACASNVTSTATTFYVCNPVTRTAYPGNIVPVSAFDPTVVAIFNSGAIGLPNPSQSGDTKYTRRDLQRNSQSRDEYLLKGDVNLTGKQRVTLSYFHNQGSNLLNPSGNNTLNWTLHNYNYVQHNANIQHTWTLSNNTVNQLFVGYTRLLGGRVATPGTSLSEFGSKINVQGTPSRAQIGVTGWFTAGNAITGPVTGNNVYLLRNVVSSTHGKHTLFFGGEANLEKDAQQTLLNNYGIFAFTQASAGTAARTSAAITDLFLGRPNTFNQDSPVYANANYWNYGAFFQDDWRILPSLTLNLGVRYDVQTAPLDTARRTLNYKPGVQSTVSPTSPIGLAFVGDPGVAAGGTSTEYTHVSPRVGFAWTPFPDGRTVIHGAAGIFFGTVGGNLFEFPSNNQPFAVRAQYKKVISVADPYTGDPSEFCAAASGCTVGTSPYPYLYNKATPRYIRPSQIITIDPDYKWPEIYQINFGFQQQFTRSLALTANYVGSLGRRLPIFLDLNNPVFATGATTANVDNRRPVNASLAGGLANPTFSNIFRIQSSESSNYNGLQVVLEQRLSRGFSVSGFYTWSKVLQSAALDAPANVGNNAATAFEDANLRYLDRQRADFDVRHQVTASFVYKSRFGFKNTFARLAANGWTATSILRLRSGQPFNVTTGTDTNADANNNDRPNLAGIGTPRLTDNGRSRAAMQANWISSSYFCGFQAANPAACPGVGPLGSDGTYRRNSLDAPGFRQIDASLFRDFTYHDRYTFQLRAEATNVFNLTNLPAPTATLTSTTTFGRINDSIANGNRILQVGGRLLF